MQRLQRNLGGQQSVHSACSRDAEVKSERVALCFVCCGVTSEIAVFYTLRKELLVQMCVGTYVRTGPYTEPDPCST